MTDMMPAQPGQDLTGLTVMTALEIARAVRDGRVYVVDSPAYFSRPGPRIVQGLEILAQIIQPKIFSGFIPEGSAAKLAWDMTRPLPSQRMSERFVPLL